MSARRTCNPRGLVAPVGFTPSDMRRIDPRQLAKGSVEEEEHTCDVRVASEIASHHLRQHRSYYMVLPFAEHAMDAVDRGLGVWDRLTTPRRSR